METILIIDFGSQYTQLIARRIRELNVFCEIHPSPPLSPRWGENNQDFSAIIETTGNKIIKGIILSGSPYSVHNDNAPKLNLGSIPKKVPLLGICYGAQLIAYFSGGKVLPSKIREYGRAVLLDINRDCTLFNDISAGSQVWMSHADTITRLPDGYSITARTNDVEVAAFQHRSRPIYGLQFHPEVVHTTDGGKLLHNFAVKVCKCRQDWTPESFIRTTVSELKNKIGSEKVALAISGGVDSTVAAVLLKEAVGKQLQCIFVDNGLLRKNEFSDVLTRYKTMHLNVKGVDSKKKFYSRLKGITDPERKRKIIGKTFIDVFENEIKRISGKSNRNALWLGQGTIYPDRIESRSVKGPSATIKSHHNVGGLPEKMKLKLVEPLNLLFKDEVRKVGKALGIGDSFLDRHPFPGPGLAVRILGEVTEEKVHMLQDADEIFIGNLRTSGLYGQVWQAATILLPVKSVGVMGDERTYQQAVCLRAVTSTDGMTADWCHLPFDFLAKVSNEIINKVKGINRVVYDISSKPPATIEWE